MLVWMGRICHCRGFGVQSPWAYRMVRYVINEHYPYYAYSDLRAAFPGLGVVERKVCELCLRLANSVRPSRVVAFGVAGEALGSYVKAGCRRADYVVVAGSGSLECMRGAEMAVIAPCDGFEHVFAAFSGGAVDGSVAVLLDIGRDGRARRLWRDIVAGRQGVVTFDLYYCGLVFFDRKRYKQNYVINF